jgi:DNA-binding ferritin-like protein (Dps family)
LTEVDNLKGWYKNKFEIINRYCTLLLEGVDRVTKSNIMTGILDEFVKGQEDNIPVKAIIGDDIEKYCYSKCNNIPRRYRYKDIFKMFMYWALVLLIFDGSEILFNLDRNLLSIKTNIHSMVVSLLFCVYIIYIYRGIDKKISKINIFISTIFLLLGVTTCIFIAFNYNVQIPIIVEVFISLIICLSYVICYRKSNISRLEYINVTITNELKNSKKELVKINEKNKRKNRDLLTEEDYLDMKINSSIKALKVCKIDLLFPILFSLIPVCFTLLNNNLVDSILYFIILLTIEYIIFIPVYSNSRKINKLLIEKYTYFKESKTPINKWE